MHIFDPARIIVVLLAIAVTACAPLPQLSSLAVEQRPSLNYDARRPNYVILHYTSSDTAEQALGTLTSLFSRVSSHYLVGRDGKIHYLVDEGMRAWHAGVSYWGGNRDLNSASIGIELDNNGAEPYAEAQIEALLALLADLQQRYAIPAENFLGHSDVAPLRKSDPGRHFPWQRLASRGFGLWCESPYPSTSLIADDPVALAALGYDVGDLDAAIAAFKLHYAPDSDPRQLTAVDRALLSCLVAKKLKP